MRRTVVAIVCIVVATVPVAGQKSVQKASAPTTVNDQSIRIGKAVVARPFGAELVNRLSLVGSYRVRGQRVHLVRGDTGGACPARFVFVTETPGAAPAISTPFGTCSGAVRVRMTGGALVAAMPIGSDGAISRFAFDGATVRPLDAALGQAEPACLPASRVDTTTQSDTIAAFENEYPEEFRSTRALRKVTIDTAEMRTLVTTLACLAPWPAAEHRIPAAATPLFASRHGAAAFASLASIAEDPGTGPNLRAAARSFAAEMSYRVGRRQTL